MFGFRPDGRRIPQEDAILAFAPYFMPQRVDSQVHTLLRLDCDVLTRYIRDQRGKGLTVSYMDLLIAAYVRTISQYPDLNRFIANKQLYARNDICVSLAILKTFENSDAVQEATIKLHFRPYDTLSQVSEVIQSAIEENRKPVTVNDTDRVARLVVKTPGLPTTILAVGRLLDRYGLLPRFLVNASPFHTGLFITNMASLGMPHVNHHIYNFGTTSVFLSMGKTERVPVPGPGGTCAFKRVIPVGVVSDERITSGAMYGRAFGYWRDLLAQPARLETPPETVRFDIPPEKMPLALDRPRRRLRRETPSIGA